MTGFVFPGQGSQYPGMGRDVAAFGPAGRDLVAAAARDTGLPLDELMTTADATTIADPQIAQLLIFTYSGVVLQALRERDWHPQVVAGHSLGEYTALVACGSLDWGDALALVAHRGRAMAAAARSRPGAMGAVVGLPTDQVARLCREATTGGELAVVANINSARQTVVSGTVAAVEAVLAKASAGGALRARRLPVGGAYHSPLMAPAERELAPMLRAVTLRPPALPLVSSVTGAQVTDLAAYREQLIGQITGPVRWHAVTRAIEGTAQVVEVGPGRVLCGLGRESLRGTRHLTALDAVRAPRPVEAGVS